MESGDYVEVRGAVVEHFGRTELVTDPEGITINNEAQHLPTPIELNPQKTTKKPTAIWKRTRVCMPAVNGVGPTNADGESWENASAP